MRIRLFRSTAIVLVLVTLAAPIPAAGGNNSDCVTVDSQILEGKRTLRIRLPQDYERSQVRYPVLYMLDGEWSFERYSPVVESLIREGSIPDLIIVAVENVNEHTRLWDFTPTAVERYPGSGGGGPFLQFIQTELVPWIDNEYRTSSVRLICGHSLAGLMSTYTFLNHPDLFSGCIASSPSFSWDKELMVRTLGDYLTEGRFQGSFIYLAIGSEDFQTYLEAMEKVVPIMQEKALEGLRWEHRLYENEDHETVPDHSFPDGIKLFFEK